MRYGSMKELREMIRDLRTDHDLKQKEVAQHLNIAQQTYSNYERGHRQIPAWVIVELAKYYKVSTDYLLGADTSYLGITNLGKTYVANITMYDMMYAIQTLNPQSRKNLLSYLRYLKNSEKLEKKQTKTAKQ